MIRRCLNAGFLAACASLAQARGLDPAKALTQYNLDVWTTERGLPQNTATAVVQTRDGYLWVGTFGGLARFDGARFVVFDKSNTPALRNSGVQSLLADRDGGLWIGTNGGGLTRIGEDGQAQTFTTADGLGGDAVRALFQDKEGRLWAGTNGGLSLFEGGKFRTWRAADGFTASVVRAIREDLQGALWIGTNGDGLYRLKDGRFEHRTRRDGLPSDFVFSLTIDREGSLWIGTNGGGLARLRDGKIQVYGAAAGLLGDIIWSLYEDREGSLWVGTYGAGLFRRDGERFKGLTTHTGLSSDFVRALHQDHEGSLWIGTNAGGLARLRDGKFTTYTSREGLPSDVAKSVVAGKDGSLWVGTSGGGLARFKDGVFKSWSRKDGLPQDFVQALHFDEAGALWVGTNGGGIARFENGAFRAYNTRDGLADDHVSAIAGGPDGALWIGTNAGVSRFKHGVFTNFARRQGLAADLVMTTLVDRSGTVWVGTDGGGLTQIRGEELHTFTTKDGLAADSILSLHEDADGGLWIGTSGGGLSRFKDGRFLSVSTRDGLREDVVFAMLEDGHGGLWLSGNRGVSRVEKAALLDEKTRPLQPLVFGVADGMKSNECSGVSQPAAARMPDGRLVFPTTRGVAMIDPGRIERNPEQPQVHVEEVIAGGRVYHGRHIELPATAANWEIRFTALSLIAPERVRFEYRLSGVDDDWIEAEGRRAAFYTQTPPGQRSFEVRASNNDGVWSEHAASLEIGRIPRFHETRAFAILIALGVMLSLASAYALRVRSLQARHRELEKQVEERTHELREQRERAERQREIAQRANAVKTEMLSIAAHDLKNPMQLVLGYAEMAELQLEQGKPTSGLIAQIHAAAERVLGILSSLLESATLDAGQLTLRRERIDIATVAAAVVQDSRAAAERKRQRLEFKAAGPVSVDGDAERLFEIIENLVSNAVKYSPLGSGIAVTVREEGESVVVEVVDEGPGITEEDRSRLFGAFQRLSARPTGGETSTGLGLSIAKKLAELHGGAIGADSSGTGTGSRFTLRLPRTS